jgi:hypothetical protein
MTDFTVDSTAPMTGRSIAAGVAKIPPAIIVAAAALGAYQVAPVLVDYFKPSRPLYMRAPDVRPLTPEPVTEPVQKQMTQPAPPPVVRQEQQEAPAAPPVPVIVPPRMEAPPAPSGVIVRPAMRGRFVRVRPPRLSFAQGLSGVRGMIRLGHVVQMLHFIRRFHR